MAKTLTEIVGKETGIDAEVCATVEVLGGDLDRSTTKGEEVPRIVTKGRAMADGVVNFECKPECKLSRRVRRWTHSKV